MLFLEWFTVGYTAAGAILKLLIVLCTGFILEYLRLLTPDARKFMSEVRIYVVTLNL